MNENNSFIDKSLNNIVANGRTQLNFNIFSEKTAIDKKEKDTKKEKDSSKEKFSKAQSVYEDWLENWTQDDPIPLIPPGKEFILCQLKLNEMDSGFTGGRDVPELTKKPFGQKSAEEQLLLLKTLGPKLSENVQSLIGRVANARGLWIDDKNKLRCPPGTPAANQFTDITGSNCFIPSPETAAGTARRAIRKVTNAADLMSRAVGDRLDTSQSGSAARVSQYTVADTDRVLNAMAVGGRVTVGEGLSGAMRSIWGRSGASRVEPKKRAITQIWHLPRKERVERGKISTVQADVLHRRLLGLPAPLPVTPSGLRQFRAMARQMGTASMFLLPSGNPVGDITKRENFVRAMTELFPNVDIAEIEQAFEVAIPANLTFGERIEAKKGWVTFWENILFDGIQNPDKLKWITQLNYTPGSDSAFEVKAQHFGAHPASGSRMAGVAVTNAANASQFLGADGGLTFSMNYNPAAMYSYMKGWGRSEFSDGSGARDSIQGQAAYLAIHEMGHVTDFSEKLKALGLDVNTLSRYGKTYTVVPGAKGSPPEKKLDAHSGGWIIDWSMVSNPTGNASIQQFIDAAQRLKTTNYTGSRYGARRIDMQQDLAEFINGFLDGMTNNVNTTAAEHEIMRRFAGGRYAADSPVEARAEFYVARRLYGESTMFPDTATAGGTLKTSVKDKNLIEKWVRVEAEKRFNDSGMPASSRNAEIARLEPVILRELEDVSINTYGVSPGGWNLSGLMRNSGQDDSARTSLHARRVQQYVAAAEIGRKRNSAANIGLSGKMASSMPPKPVKPREPDNGPYTGEFAKIFSGVKDFEDFAKRYRDQTVIFFDYETTGLDPLIEKPVQIGAVKMRNGKVVDRFNIFVNPGKALSDWSKANLRDANGNPLTDEWLLQQASIKEAHEKLLEFFGENALLGGQYTPFDLGFLEQSLKASGLEYKPAGVIDSKAMADELLPRWSPDKPDGPFMLDAKTGEKKASNSLGPLAEYLGVELGDGWHLADADSEASALIIEKMLDRSIEKQDVTPKTILDPDEIPNIVERRRAKFKADMEQYERDKIDYESALSGKMSVPSFETANGSKYERQADGTYKRTKNINSSTTIDGPVNTVEKVTTLEDVVKDDTKKFAEKTRQVEELSQSQLDELFSDGEYTYVVHRGAEEIVGGALDPNMSMGQVGDGGVGNTRNLNADTANRLKRNVALNEKTVEDLTEYVGSLKSGKLITNPTTNSNDRAGGLSPLYVAARRLSTPGARRSRFDSDKDRPWPDSDDLSAMRLTQDELVSVLEQDIKETTDKVNAEKPFISLSEQTGGQYTSGFRAADIVKNPRMGEGYGGRYSKGKKPGDRLNPKGEWGGADRQGIHVVRVKLGKDATNLWKDNMSSEDATSEVHMFGKPEVIATLTAPTTHMRGAESKTTTTEISKALPGWLASVVEQDKISRREGISPTSGAVETVFDKTVFITPESKKSVQLAADRGRHINPDGKLMGMSFDDTNLDTGKLLSLRRSGKTFDDAFEEAGGKISHFPLPETEIRTTPQPGLHPFEWTNDGKSTHMGSAITAVKRQIGDNETPSLSGKMTSNQAEKISKEFTSEIKEKAKSINLDLQEKPSPEKIQESISAMVDTVAKTKDKSLQPITLPQRAIEIIKMIADKKKAEFSDASFLDSQHENNLFAIHAAIHEADRNIWPLRTPMPDNVRLEITKQIHLARGDTKAAQEVDNFREYLRTASPEQISEDIKNASIEAGKNIDKRVVVRTRSMSPFIKGEKNILTHHDIEKRKEAGIESMSGMGDDTTSSGRMKTEENLLGIPKNNTPEANDLRPSSGYAVPTKVAETRAQHLKRIYGDDVEIMHQTPVGSHLESVSAGLTKYGESAFILRPEAAERTRIYSNDTVALSTARPEPVNLSTLSDDASLIIQPQNALGILYDYKTGDKSLSVAGGFERSIEGNGSNPGYKEALVVGRFKPEEIETIYSPLKDFRKTNGQLEDDRINPNTESNISLIIDAAQARDEMLEKHGIEVVPKINAGISTSTDEVELFNPTMTDKWFTKHYAGKHKKEEIIPDKETTPYEAILRMEIADRKAGKSGLVEYRGNKQNTTKEERETWRLDALEKELERAIKTRKTRTTENNNSGLSGKMTTDSDRSIRTQQRNESIMSGITKAGSSWSDDFLSEKYISELPKLVQLAQQKGAILGGDRRIPATRERTQKRVDTLVENLHKDLQEAINGNGNNVIETRGYPIEFIAHVSNMSPVELKQNIRDAVIDFHSGLDPRVRIQTPRQELKSILENGYKTVHGINQSDHSQTPIRTMFETYNGIHPDVPAELRPASGYIIHKDWEEREIKDADKMLEGIGTDDSFPELVQNVPSRKGRGNVDIYGHLEITLRPEVANRTRYIMGDSLNNWIDTDNPAASTPLVGTNIDSIEGALLTAQDGRHTALELLHGAWSKNHGQSTRHDNGRIPHYIEALVSGSFDKNDIESVSINLSDIPLNWLDFDVSRPIAGVRQPRQDETLNSSSLRQIGRLIGLPDFSTSQPEELKKLGFDEKSIDHIKGSGARLLSESGIGGEALQIARAVAADKVKETLTQDGIELKVRNKAGFDISDPEVLAKRWDVSFKKGMTVRDVSRAAMVEYIKQAITFDMQRQSKKLENASSVA